MRDHEGTGVCEGPDELNEHLRTAIIAPMTSAVQAYPFRVACRFAGKARQVVIDQLRTVDHERLVRHIGKLSSQTLREVLVVLGEMFAP